MGHRKKTFQEKVDEHERLKAAAHRAVDQMTTKELYQFFRRRQQFLKSESEPQIAAMEK
jgi:hypothetical protein